MLTNATITRVDTQGATMADGRRMRIEGASIAVRCLVDAVSSRHRHSLGATLEDADQVVYVAAGMRDGMDSIGPGDRMIIQVDGREASGGITVEIVTLGDRIGPGGLGLSHLELFVRRAPL